MPVHALYHQAALWRSHLVKIVTPMRAQLQLTRSAFDRMMLARDMAFFTIAFSTTNRSGELVSTLIHRIMRLPNRSSYFIISNGVERRGPSCRSR